MDERAPGADEKQAVLESLAILYPWIRAFYSRPIRDYAIRLFEAPASETLPEIRRHALTKLLGVIRTAGKRNGLSVEAVTRICQELEARRVLQTGPHLLLLLDPEAYYTHVFSLLGLAGHGCSTYLSYAVSTVSLAEKARKGPGWLAVDRKPINVFGLSRSRMIGYSLLTGPGSYQFELTPAEQGSEGATLAQLRKLLPKGEFERPAHAIKAANLMLWPQLFGDRFAFLQIDDEDIADLVAEHLSDEGSWLRARLLENPRLALNILTEIDRLADSSWGGWLARSTDFFWLYENGRRLPLRLAAGELINQASGTKVARFAAPDIIERLTDRTLIPNLFVMFLVVSILPGVRALGGSHQPVYFPLMRYILFRALKGANVDADLRHALASDDVPGAWGHRVIECDDEPFEMLRSDGIVETNDLIDRFGNVPFSKACGSMSGFVSDTSWQELQKGLRKQAIAATDAEWALS